MSKPDAPDQLSLEEQRLLRAKILASTLEDLLGVSLVEFLFRPESLDHILDEEKRKEFDGIKEEIEKLGFIMSFHISVAPAVYADKPKAIH
jgi:hypothetical protein